MSAPARILIIGTGSAGRRHARNLAALGASVSCFDPRQDRLDQARQEIPGIAATFLAWEQAREAPLDAAVISSPPNVHAGQAIELIERRLPVLLEKPVAPDLASALRVAEAAATTGSKLLLGYTYRWWPPFVELRRRVAAQQLGALRHARFVMSAHLADWHPWERYQDFFMAAREQGGGALLDESHFIDLALWLFGSPANVSARVERLSSLEITSDDNVDAIAEYPNGLRLTIHLDLYGRPHDRSVTVVGERGTLQCLFDPNRLLHGVAPSGWQETRFECERNDMFVAMAREFLEILGGSRAPSCTIDDGVGVLKVVEAIRRSSAESRSVSVPR